MPSAAPPQALVVLHRLVVHALLATDPEDWEQLLACHLIAGACSLEQFFGVGLVRRVHRILPTAGSA
jgi:hypothetical protein